MYFVSESHKLICSVSEKCNSVGVGKMFLEYIGELQKALDYHPWIHRYLHNVYMPKHRFPNHSLLSHYTKIKFVRCPYDRFVSIFLHMLKHKIIQNISFRQFVKTFHQLRRKHVTLSSHSHVQTDHFHWDYIVHIENMNNEVNQSELKEFKFNVSHTSSHWSRPSHKGSDQCVSDVTRYEDLRVAYPCFYDKEIRKNVEKYYRHDLENFGYTYEQFLSRWKEAV
jgi:hypothetical protein